MTNHYSRMVYASKATFKPFKAGDSIDKDVKDILTTARRENKKNNLVGALYYGNGCFFQCLEGNQQDIDQLYAKLEKDPRHHELKVLSLEPVEQRSFSSWEMKYATIDREVRAFLRTHQMGKFNPYRFSPEMTAELVGLLQQADENAGEFHEPTARQPENRGVSMTVFWLTNIISIIATAIITLWLVQA
ncbi:BLUF domain-containing protein [Alkanindiges illinoisensis]|uniref:BLUF domain-containing protein n=1 Tax=Alkanindiges illinoisensis TaxID=197183 RepID=UPI000A06E746|nr:BLUF domain-containing protein [Alkanindiges illinoisensis]